MNVPVAGVVMVRGATALFGVTARTALRFSGIVAMAVAIGTVGDAPRVGRRQARTVDPASVIPVNVKVRVAMCR